MPEQSEPATVPDSVSAVLRALTPTDALTRALQPASRSPGHLSWAWAVVSEEELAAVAGFFPPRLPAAATAGLCELFAVPGRNGAARLQRDGSGRLSTWSFAVFYLPESSTWRRARRSSVLSGDSIALYANQADEQEWPREMGRRRWEFAADGSLLPLPPPDFALVHLAGTAVGVQVDTSGVVALGWSVRREVGGGERRWNLALYLRREPEEALRLVHDAGLLT